jgi:hypothetical protein
MMLRSSRSLYSWSNVGELSIFPHSWGSSIKHEFTEFLIDTGVVGKDEYEQER